jgi:hypothetical protein
LSSKISAIAIMLLLVFLDMEVMTAVPLLPQPMTPTRMAELAFDPKTIPGLKMEKAETAAVFLMNVLLCMMV